MYQALSDIPREPRRELCGLREVLVQRRHDLTPRTYSGQLLDLTSSGARLESDEPLPIEEIVTLQFCCGDFGLNFIVEAQIRWSRPAEGQKWWMGCAFAPKLPEEYLDRLAGEGLLDRRREARRKLDLQATARWEPEANRQTVVRISDLSSGGFGLISPEPAAPGQRLLISPRGASVALLVPARCQWQVQGDDEFRLGCSFADETGFARIAEAARVAASEDAVMLASPRRSWFWPWNRDSISA